MGICEECGEVAYDASISAVVKLEHLGPLR